MVKNKRWGEKFEDKRDHKAYQDKLAAYRLHGQP